MEPNITNPDAADPGHVIAAVPTLLHQTPTESMVLLLGVQGLIRRHCVFPLEGSPNLLYARMTRAIGDGPADTAYLIGITTALAVPAPGQFAHLPAPYRALPGAFIHALTERGITPAGVWATTAVQPATPWWSLTGFPRTGTVDDPATIIPDTGPQVLTGLHDPYRDALEMFARDLELTGQVAAALPGAQAAAEARLTTAIRNREEEAHFRGEVDAVHAYLSELSRLSDNPDTDADPADLARITVIMRCGRVRDELYAQVAAGPGSFHATDPHADLTLWGLLTTGTEGEDQAHAAALLALGLYTRAGDPTAARVAVEIAVRADPQHRVAVALHEAIRQRLHPADVRAAFLHVH
ncbi:DUF4192 domain-containing protein [Nocardia yamanashiensis]|uniref:DUF4192 domain-containing protein n=1 Tax=Nocardia yamanashiensis TaxID=209247 RepID=UPI000834D245|nr:DUF4192 domain-containing protein [Nocardia yamanashiensis]